MAQDVADARAHLGQLALVVELLLKALEHAPFWRVEQAGVAVQQPIDHRTPMLLRAQNGLTQRAVGGAPRVFDAPKIGSQAGGQREQVANAFHRLRIGQQRQTPGAHLVELVLQIRNAPLHVLGAALRIRVERVGEVVDLALHHSQARGGGGHQAVVELRHKTQRVFERVGFKQPTLALGDHAPANPVAQLAPGLRGGVGGVDLEVGQIGVGGQHVGQRLHRVVQRHAIALVLKQRLQTTEHERRSPRSQHQPSGVLLARGDVFLGALLVEAGHGGLWAVGCPKKGWACNLASGLSQDRRKGIEKFRRSSIGSDFQNTKKRGESTACFFSW